MRKKVCGWALPTLLCCEENRKNSWCIKHICRRCIPLLQFLLEFLLFPADRDSLAWISQLSVASQLVLFWIHVYTCFYFFFFSEKVKRVGTPTERDLTQTWYVITAHFGRQPSKNWSPFRDHKKFVVFCLQPVVRLHHQERQQLFWQSPWMASKSRNDDSNVPRRQAHTWARVIGTNQHL